MFNQPPGELRHSLGGEPLDQMTLGGFLPTRDLPVQGLDRRPAHWLLWDPQGMAQTPILGHLGTIPLGPEESDGTPKNLSLGLPWCYPRDWRMASTLFPLLLTVRA